MAVKIGTLGLILSSSSPATSARDRFPLTNQKLSLRDMFKGFSHRMTKSSPISNNSSRMLEIKCYL